MKVAVGPTTVPAVPALRQRLADYVELTKPRIAVMVLITVAAGYLAAAGTSARLLPLIHTLIGTALVAGGASAWNMWLERVSDARMRRTANRPLPSGRLNQIEAVVFGTALAVTGVNYLFHALATPAAALVATLTFLIYVAVYTPLKSLTPWNTHVGAIPGALPPIIGWTAATGTIGWNAVALFLILLFWQLPHFMAIAWMYRSEYGRAGLKMIPVGDPTGARTSRAMIGWCVVLVAVSILPAMLKPIDWVYAFGAVMLGGFFLASAWKFRTERTEQQARKVLRASILYLPGIMGLFLVHVFLTGCAPESKPSAPAVKPDGLSIPVPEFQLTERSGKTLARDDLKGKVWVASFVFVRCPGPCPQVTATMARLQKELDLTNTPELRLVTFTVDPERDNPKELTDYANRYQAHPERWLFLTGQSEAELHALLKDGFKVTAQRAANPKDEFDHSSRLAVVDKQGNIRGYFDGIRSSYSSDPEFDFDANLQRLKVLVGELLKE
jgi:protoheme IX farnesyltransferase